MLVFVVRIAMNLLLDTGILGQLCHPSKPTNQPVSDWVELSLTLGR